MKVKTSPNYMGELISTWAFGQTVTTSIPSNVDMVTHLLAVLLEERRGVHAIRDCTPDDGEPAEDHGWLVGVLEEELACDMVNDGQAKEGAENKEDLGRGAVCLELLRERVRRDIL